MINAWTISIGNLSFINRWTYRIRNLALARRASPCFGVNPMLILSRPSKKLCLTPCFENVKHFLSTEDFSSLGLIQFYFLMCFVVRHDGLIRWGRVILEK